MARTKDGFTLSEITIVVSIIAVILGATTISFREVLQKGRDDRRIADINQAEVALELYRRQIGQYPEEDTTDEPCTDGYDRSRAVDPEDADFLSILEDEGFMSRQSIDPTNTGNCTTEFTYKYQRFSPGTHAGCPAAAGGYFVLGIANLEQVPDGQHHPTSPGWSCGATDWHDEFEWVTGGFDGQP